MSKRKWQLLSVVLVVAFFALSGVIQAQIQATFRAQDPGVRGGPPGAGRYTYTPRKVLRRVLDHSLDHLNQIEQWLRWRRDGLVPTPTDGWVPSTVT